MKAIKNLGDLLGGVIASDKKDIAKSGYDAIRTTLRDKSLDATKQFIANLVEKGRVDKSYIKNNPDSWISLNKALEGDDISVEKIKVIQKIFLTGAVKGDSNNKTALYIDAISKLSLGEILTMSAIFKVLTEHKVPKYDSHFICNSLHAIENVSSLKSINEVATYCESLISRGLIIDFDHIHDKIYNRGTLSWKIRIGNIDDESKIYSNFILTDYGFQLCEFISFEIGEDSLNDV